ncbi:outer membrane protein assembly factor BamB family protein [Micromonosporaceae bacterium Da 78-11]
MRHPRPVPVVAVALILGLTACGTPAAPPAAPVVLHFTEVAAVPVPAAKPGEYPGVSIATGAHATYLSVPDRQGSHVTAIDHGSGQPLWDVVVPYVDAELTVHADGSLDLRSLAPGSTVNYVVAVLDPATGRERWHEFYHGARSKIGDTMVIWDDLAGGVVGYDMTTGSRRWFLPHDGRDGIANPVDQTSGKGPVEPADNRSAYQHDQHGVVERVDATTGTLTMLGTVPIALRHIILGGRLITLTEEGMMTAFDMADLTRPLWSVPAGDALGVEYFEIMQCAPDLLCVSTNATGHRLYGYDARTGQQLWSRDDVLGVEQVYPGKVVVHRSGTYRYQLVDSATGTTSSELPGLARPARIATDGLLSGTKAIEVTGLAQTAAPNPVVDYPVCDWQDDYSACVTVGGAFKIWHRVRE